MEVKAEARKKLIEKKIQLCIELDKSPNTIDDWIYKNPHRLLKKPNLRAIKKHTGLTEKELFEDAST